jgi:hypothetical protein
MVVMFGQAVVIATVVVLRLWHSKTRRHPGWRKSHNGRFYVTMGYPSVTIAMYWLTQATVTTGLEWTFGICWAFVAMVLFVYGFESLAFDAVQQPSAVSAATPAAPPSVPRDPVQDEDDHEPSAGVALEAKGRHRRR